MVNAIDNIISKINFQTMMPKNTGNGQQMTPFNSGADLRYTPVPAWNVSPTADKTGLNPNNYGGLNKNQWSVPTVVNPVQEEDTPTNRAIKSIMGKVDVSKFGMKPTIPDAFAEPINYVTDNSVGLPDAQTWWDKAKDFATSPTGGSLLTALMTGGLVAATGGNGLEALSYGAQSGGTATKTWQEQRNKELKRKQEDDYLQARIAEQQADREARQLETDKRIANDWGLTNYKHNLEEKLLGTKNELENNSPYGFKDAERLSANFANRMVEASKALDAYENNGGNAWGNKNDNLISYAGKVAGSALPDFMGGSALQRVTASDDKNKYDSMAQNWITANLRKESGAAITADEFAKEKEKYFPQVGDSKTTILEKQRMRKEAEKGMIFQSGRAYDYFTGNQNKSNDDPLGIR